MATITVKLRRSEADPQTGTIYYRLSHRRQVRWIATGIRLSLGAWNAAAERIVAADDTHRLLQHRIDGDVRSLRRIVRELEASSAAWSVHDAVTRYRALDGRLLVLDYMEQQIVRLREANRFGTACNYERACRSFAAFLGGMRLPFAALTEQLIGDYNAYLLRRGVVRNTISFYMRILRAVYNKAVRQRLTEQLYPFREVYTGIDRTRKRAVSEAVLVQLYRLELPCGSPLALARDLFLFSYCTRGMAFVDIAYLQKGNLRDGMICYARRKTGRQLTVKIEPGIRRILDRYRSADSPYLFPLLTSTDPVEAFRQYRRAMDEHNRSLRKLSALLPDGCRLTSYTARHSWATVARDRNVPIAVISEGMGHTSEQMTRIYLTMLEHTVIDRANRLLIGIFER